MKKLEAVIFDMDGVLFDTERMSCECCFEAAKQLGLTLAEEAVYGGCGRNEASLRRHIMETEEPWYPNGTFPYGCCNPHHQFRFRLQDISSGNHRILRFHLHCHIRCIKDINLRC